MGFEPIQALLPKGFSYHFRFHYQLKKIDLSLRIVVCGLDFLLTIFEMLQL